MTSEEFAEELEKRGVLLSNVERIFLDARGWTCLGQVTLQTDPQPAIGLPQTMPEAEGA